MQPTTLARAMWTLYEPIHAITYFAAGARAEFEAAGLRGFWRGYFAGRAAPLGLVGGAGGVGSARGGTGKRRSGRCFSHAEERRLVDVVVAR